MEKKQRTQIIEMLKNAKDPSYSDPMARANDHRIEKLQAQIIGDAELRTQLTEMLEDAKTPDYSIQLPETEYDVMCAVWDGEIPITTGYLMQVLGNKRGWKTPTLVSFLHRLEERGYLASVKSGKERFYFPLAEKKLYKEAVTRRFVKRYYGGSFLDLMDALFPSRTMSDADIDALLTWLRSGV